MLFRSSSDRYYFENWLNNISNFSTNTVGYYDDWASNIEITVYDENVNLQQTGVTSNISFPGSNTTITSPETVTQYGNYGYKVTVLNAIPLSIDEVDLSWADTDKLLEYTVIISYEQIKIDSNNYISTNTMI